MSESYIPTSDGLALTWMQTFSDGISANVAGYMVSSADAANIASVVSDYAAAYALAVDPATRTPVNVIGKDNARNVAAPTRWPFFMTDPVQGGSAWAINAQPAWVVSPLAIPQN